MPKMSSDDLFCALAGSRPERLLHNALWWVIQRPQAKCLRRKFIGRGNARVDVENERSQPDGWRADLVIHAGGRERKELIRVELKVRSAFTDQQRKALARAEIDLLVRPSGAKKTSVSREVTWSEVAHLCQKDGFVELAEIFKAGNTFGSATRESAKTAALLASFEAFVAGGEDAWSEMYRFIWSVDECLASDGPSTLSYEAQSGWSHSRASKYYGYHFRACERRFWLGFWGRYPGCFVLQESTSRSRWADGGRISPIELAAAADVRVDVVARRVAKEIRKHAALSK